ncbi:hypothetical protein UlMin_027379 [Ulmus minor]
MLHKKIPQCGIRAQPHIDSCVKILKKQYNAIANILGPSASGFGWNDEAKCIIVEKNVFDEWVKSLPTAKGLRNKPFPHYDELGIVFGKDRANGQGAMGMSEMVDKIDKDTKDTQEVRFDPLFNQFEDLDGNVTESPTTTRSTKSSKRTKKRSRSGDALAETVNQFGSMYATASVNIGRITNCFQHETDSAERRMKLFDELKKLVTNQAKIDYFFTLDDEFKLEFLLQMFEWYENLRAYLGTF